MLYNDYENEGDFDEVYAEYQKRYGQIQDDEGEEEGVEEVAEQIERIIEEQVMEEQLTEEQIMEEQLMQQEFMPEQVGEAEEEFTDDRRIEPPHKESVDIVVKSPRISCQYEEPEPEPDKSLDPAEVEFVHAKNYLQTVSKASGDNLYDHLTDVLNKVLAERPENVIDFFEEYSRKIKEKRFKPMTDHLEDIFVEPERFQLAKCMMPWLKARHQAVHNKPCRGKVSNFYAVDMSGNNMLELLFYLEQVGLGLPKQEVAFITLSMRQLVKTEPIVSIRFWGKVYGIFNNYIIVETELKEEEYIKRNETHKKSFSDTYLYKRDTKVLFSTLRHNIPKVNDVIARINNIKNSSAFWASRSRNIKALTCGHPAVGIV